MFTFSVSAQDKKTNARRGTIHTPHGSIQTPAFVPVGTQASVKSLSPHDLIDLSVPLYFVNTYHMMLRPGMRVIQKAGGLHAFMHWDRPLITDSGGFQVFSLGRNNSEKHTTGDSPSLVNISEDGVTFRSHWDGELCMLNPEVSMDYQWQLGSDIHIAFDDCTPYPVTHDQAKASMDRTHRWATRSLSAHQKLAHAYRKEKRPYQALYGSIQGSVYADLRKASSQFIASLDTDGIAIGGVSVGESKEEMRNVLTWVQAYLPEHKPRHLLGVGEIDDIFALVAQGIDTFDCVLPTRLARNGYAYVSIPRKRTKGISASNKDYLIDISKKTWESDFTPLDPGCGCYTCQTFTKAYLHHLFHVKELVIYRLLSMHNLSFLQHLVADIRNAIDSNTFLDLQNQWLYDR